MQLSKNGADGRDSRGAFTPRQASAGEIDVITQVVGVTGVEPVTLRLSSACSNQLSYTPRRRSRNFRFQIRDLKYKAGGAEETRTPDL